MSTKVKEKQNQVATHCRHCNHRLEHDDQRCPGCGQGQGRMGEAIALILMLVVVSLVTTLILIDGKTEETSLEAPGLAERSRDRFAEPFRESDRSTESRHSSLKKALTPSDPRKGSANRPSRVTQLPPTGQSQATASSNYQGTAFRQTQGDFPYYVAEKKWNRDTKRYDFHRRGMEGAEIIRRGDARRYFISEDQSDYPEPASGCGPTALLNLYTWYSKFGLLEESVRHSDPKRYKALKFQQIDRKIREIQRESRTRHGGTNTLAAIVAMDELVQQYSRRPLRVHFEIKKPPLTRKDFTELSRNYRAGILSVRPKNKVTGQLMGNHAVLCIRGDTSGMITVANWGEFSHGRLVNRKDGQWFLPKDAKQHELKINSLTVLLPFTPKSES